MEGQKSSPDNFCVGLFIRSSILGELPRWLSGKESACQCRRHKRRRFNPWVGKIPWIKKISPGCSLEGLMLKLKLQYFGHLMRRVDSFERTLMLGKIDYLTK